MASTSFTDGVTLVQSSWLNDIDTAGYAYLTATAGTNTITATGPTSQTAYAVGQTFRFIPANTNTGASTLNISNLGAKSIFLRGAALAGGELFKNQPAEVVYDGTQFNIIGNSAFPPVPRSWLAGLTLSTAGSSATMSIAAGQAADSTNSVLMNLASSIGKTTSAWTVGTGNGGLDTGAIATATWYHFYEIMRPDTSVVDVLFSLSASSPTMPTNYTLKRRIGSGLTNGSSQWAAFIQDGDFYQWLVPGLESTSANAGTSAITQTLANVPTGVNVRAVMNIDVTAGAANGYLSDLATTDAAVSSTISPGTNVGPTVNVGGQIIIRTNTSAQIRTRLSASGGGQQLIIVTTGWYDRRGQDS